MLIEVTAADIAAGERGMCRTCPVVLAVERATGMNAIILTSWYCHIKAPDEGGWKNATKVRLPDNALEFIERFDAGCEVAPFAFQLDFPSCAEPASEVQ